MADRDDHAQPIEGQRLTSWSVLPGGESIRLDLSAADGSECSVVLPFDALSSLLMTLPRMLQAALDMRCSGGSLCVAQLLGQWRLEQTEDDIGLILKLSTPDGFEVAFALNGKLAGSLGRALVATSRTIGADRPASLH
jgi:hypothetical protein